MWRFVSVLNVLRTPSMPRALLRLPIRSMSSETAAGVEVPELPGLAEGSEVIGPSVFETEANAAGFPVVPVDRLKELLPKIESVLPKPHDAVQRLPACIVWRLTQAVASAKNGLYFIPAEKLKLVRWVTPQELEQSTKSATPRFQA